MENKETPIKTKRFAEAIAASQALAGTLMQQASERLLSGTQDLTLENDVQLAGLCIAFSNKLMSSFLQADGIGKPPVMRT